ncbi:CPBP family intramembrane glutamic endopeptidase [Luteimonas sp. RIT-PG2_3]
MRPIDAFPFQPGGPAAFDIRDCAVVLLACALAFAALLDIPRAWPGALGGWAAAVTFVVVQLAGLAIAVGAHWRTLFNRPTRRDVLFALGLLPFVSLLPAAVAFLVVGSPNLVANPALQAFGTMAPAVAANAFAATAVQLLGEELITILPLLCLLALLQRAGLRPWLAIGLSWLATSLAFGALHLSTYGWHMGQALLVIGTARLVLTGVFLLTRNVWASTITHIANDGAMMALAMLAASRAA